MCSGRVDPLFIIEGFLAGADGIMVAGCKLGECKYLSGNLEAVVMGEVIYLVLENIGLNIKRFRKEWVSSSESARIAEIIKDFTKILKELGPLGKGEGLDKETLILRLRAAENLCKNMQFRAQYANLCKEIKKLGDYSEESIKAKAQQKLSKVIKNKLYEFEIKKLMKQGPQSLEILQEKTGATPEEIQKILESFKKKGG